MLGNDPDIDPFGPQLSGVSVPETMGMNTFSDTGLASQSREEHADVAILKGLAVEQAKDRFLPVDVMGGPDL